MGLVKEPGLAPTCGVDQSVFGGLLEESGKIDVTELMHWCLPVSIVACIACVWWFQRDRKSLYGLLPYCQCWVFGLLATYQIFWNLANYGVGCPAMGALNFCFNLATMLFWFWMS
ncbi:hypothetical protein KIPB_007844, partial [Kipferlia bialata]|eukprot:g7844.t1